MSEQFENSAVTPGNSAASVAEIKERIANIASLPLSEHSNEFEQIHAELQKVLAEIDGL